ncbi:plasma membrane fusion protein prm1 [Pseudogymnoascus destructans]|uniref:Plasma membrane fusion protein PRM1 n=1 Tax=Pseudogymnoascus destructans TaxID=655981 RepID=A0A177AC17_9PEZI|nr:plasma membrane fusion protein prm1 [Pseudogymnoascus destructans]OAF59646.2 plasma membrane fusion protein prm1 [Pseudogymnoascus destructans]
MAHVHMPPSKADSFPPLPGNLDARHHDLQGEYARDSNGHIAPDAQYTPYLGLRAKLSQVWINKWTILLLLVLARVLLAIQGLDNNIASAKAKALSACTSVENVGSAMASMPHYMSGGVNAMAASGVTKAVNGLMSMLMLAVTGVEEIVLFIINMMTSTYICLITLVVGGALHAALEVIDKAGQFLNKTLGTVTGEITDGINGFQSHMNTFLKDIAGVTGLFGGKSSPPTIDLTSEMNKLKSINFNAANLDTNVKALDAKIPDFSEVHNFTNNLIRTPFEEIKKLINASTIGYRFDKSVFPVAQKEALTFCSDNNGINDFFNGLSKTADVARKAFIGIVVALAIIACVPMAYREIRKWRITKQRALLIQKQAFDPMDLMYLVARPYTSTAGIKVASKMKTTKKQVLMRWFVAYITTIPALFVLLLAFAGFFSCLCQYILVRTIEKEVPALTNQVGDFSQNVVLALNNASEQWATGANSVITSTNTKINTDVFGWVTTSTTAVNHTLNVFVDMVDSLLNETFGGTILYTPIQESLNCLLLLKIQGIEKGLTWVHDNAHVAFPLFEKDVFSLGAAASLSGEPDAESFLASPGSSASDDISGAVQHVVDFMYKTIREEAIIATVLFAVYLLIVLTGASRLMVGLMTRDKTRAEGGGAPAFSPPYEEREMRPAEFGAFRGEVETPFPRDNQDGPWMVGAVGGEQLEKVGHVGHGAQRSVGEASVGGHGRASSYGFVGEKGG